MNNGGPMQKWQMDDVPVFVAVVEQNGITAAADVLHMPKSTVSKALSRLETALGVRLLDRNTRNVGLTGDGEVFYGHCRSIMDQVEEAETTMSGLTATPSGRLVVAMPMAFGREIVAHHLNEFHEDYPQIDLDLVITSHAVDVIRDRLDLAVVVGELSDSDLIVTPLYKGSLLWVASAAYAEAHDLDVSAEELLSSVKICEKRYAHAKLPIREGGRKKQMGLGKNVIKANDPIVVREAVANGLGVSFLPEQYCKDALAKGELREVCPHIQIELSASVLNAVYPSRRLLSNKTRAFLDFLKRICERI